ncbi:MAG: hypothetical protein JXR72_07805 [Proteobacteria bacterium]|nr:hypothetical protein [Pseudomonadota bacterium]
MREPKIVFFLFVVFAALLSPLPVAAGDFGWTRDFNVRAEADPQGFRARLSARFKIGQGEVGVVLGNVDSPADAYIVFRLGEMSSNPVERVLDKYKAGKNKGWGALAQSLGIKPGSKAFHALKNGSDIYSGMGKGKDNRKDRNKS